MPGTPTAEVNDDDDKPVDAQPDTPQADEIDKKDD
jgi:hypothetical protein